ncbi:MAG: glycosyltransferase family 9 protein [Siphonobacter sp.]
MKILVIQTAFIGDVILVTSLLEKLHYHFPEAELDFMVRKGNEGLLKQHPYLHETLVWDKKAGKYRTMWKLLKYVRSQQYDYVINVQRYATTGFLTAFSGAKMTVGFDKNPLSFLFTKRIRHLFDGRHEVKRNTELVSFFTDEQVFPPKLYPTELPFEPLRPYVCIAPMSVWFTKRYPEHKWVKFLREIPSYLQVYILGGPEDIEACEHLRQAALSKHDRAVIQNMAGKLNLLQSGALMQGAVMNYVNDSGPLHLCSAVNAPTCAVYCSTAPILGFGPLADFSRIVQANEDLPCRPCGLHGRKTCPQGHFRCAEGIETSQLMDVLKEVI